MAGKTMSLTEQEREIVKTLKDAHNIFSELDHYNPGDMREWIINLHALQNIVMSREAIRNNTELFVQIDEA